MNNGFQHFTEWAKHRTFNEILGCAKGQLCGLALRYDVDEYNDKIACAFDYYPNADWDSEPSYIEVELTPKEQLIFTDLHDKEKHEKGMDELKEGICKLLNTTDEDEILTHWNDCVQNSNDFDVHRLYDFDIENLEEVLEYYDSKEVAKIIFNLHNGGFDAHDRYFYITNDYKIQTCNSIWDEINLPMFYDYITEYIKIERYGKFWDRCLSYIHEKDNVLVCKVENGDEIWNNSEKRYFVLYPANSDNAYLHIYG
jgi:hypothetical protein